VTTEHSLPVLDADFMAEFFRDNGISAAAVHSADSSAPRAESLRKLREGEIEVIFAVDVFNEGVDLPGVNTVLMFRPTESTVVFMQQLGRGLRPAPDMPYLTVVDFIGNHRSFLQKPQALVYLTGRDLPVFAALKELRDHTFSLPEGCFVDIETAAIDIHARAGELVPEAGETTDTAQGLGKLGPSAHSSHDPRSICDHFC
jgi:superfamily II DNA/RNA helicase